MNRNIILIPLFVTLSGCTIFERLGNAIVKASSQGGSAVAIKKVIPEIPITIEIPVVKVISNDCDYIIRDLSSANSTRVYCRPSLSTSFRD